MALGETAQLLVRLDLQDNLTGPASTALSIVSTQAQKADVSVQGLHTSFRQFGRVGSEVRTISLAAGDAFGVAAGEAGRLAADVGLVATGLADLGPKAFGAARGIIATQTAAAAATIEMRGLAGATAAWIASLGPFVVVAVAAGLAVNELGHAQEDAAQATVKLSSGTANLYDKLGAMRDAAAAASTPVVDLSGHVDESTHHFDNFRDSLLGVAGVLKDNPQFFHQFTDDLKDTGAGLDNVTTQAQATRAALDSLPKSVPIAIDFTININGKPGVGTPADLAGDVLGSAAGLAGPVAGGGGLAGNLQAARNAREQAAAEAQRKAEAEARARQQALEEAARKAAQAEAERQRQIAAAIRDRYQTAKQLEDDYFAKVHQNNLKAIQDEHDKAKAQHDAAIAAINDALQTQLALNAQPVNAAQAALNDVQNQQRLRDLQESVNAAFTAQQRNTDPTQNAELATRLRDAREALANFKAQLNINQLAQQQAVADAKAKHDADVATQKADALLAAADAKEKHDIIVENGRYATQQRNFNNAMQRILDDTVKKHQSLNTALQRLIDLIDRYAGKPLPTKDGQTGKAGESIHIINVNVPAITIGARAVTNAMSSQINPSQTPYVRTGQTRPKIAPGT